MTQYNAAIIIIGAIKRTSSDKLNQELGLEPLPDWRWPCAAPFVGQLLS